MKQYIQYLKYVLKHKWYVMNECFKEGLYWQGIIHDLSKFRPSEFVPYANYFHNPDGTSKIVRGTTGHYQEAEIGDPKFSVAWMLHQNRNPHHWQFWSLALDDGGILPVPMAEKYAREMVCDWVGAGKAQGFVSPVGNRYYETRRWYAKNKNSMILHPETRKYVEDIIGRVQVMSDLPTLDEDLKSIIRDISSSFAIAKSAKTDENSAEELVQLLRATNSIILLVKLDGVGADIQKEYASVLVDSSARIRDILLAGGTR